jgi:hypothetical protein
MSSWQKMMLPSIYQYFDIGEGFQLLNDGRVLVLGVYGSFVLSPDQYGNYANATPGPIALYPTIGTQYNSFGGHVVMHADGKVSKWGGHSFNRPHDNTVIIYDPITNAWSVVGQGSRINTFTTEIANPNDANYSTFRSMTSHEVGSDVIQLDNNVVARPTMGRGQELNTNTLALSVRTYNYSTRLQALHASVSYPTNQLLIESGWSRSPNGKFYCFSGGNVAGETMSFQSYDQTNNEVDAGLVSRPTYPTAKMYNQTSPNVTWTDASSYNGIVLSYSMVLGGLNAFANYELPPWIWWPRINRFVAIGAGLGEVWTFDPTTETYEIIGQTPQTPPPGLGFNQHSTVHADHIGMTVHQLLSGPSITMVSMGQLYSTPLINIELTNGQFLSLSPRGSNPLRREDGTPTTFVSAGATYKVMGPFRVILGPRSDDASAGVVPAGAKVTSWPPARASAEASIVILPNGNLFYNPGLCSGGNFYTEQAGETAEFDGTSFTYSEAPVWSGADFAAAFVNLPSGELLVCGDLGENLFIQSAPTTRDTLNAPIITSVPTLIRPGNSFQISGRQLMGRHVGTQQGDDLGGKSNHPIVRFINKATGITTYAPCHSYSSFTINPNTTTTAICDLPSDMEKGSYLMSVISSGNSSEPISVDVDAVRPGSMSCLIPRRYNHP